ncbi:GNAT family N-acetyltransferase [Demequina sp. NBRC 110056]|uniref:GNAT family N-acetyltransferase n=1 Tax=Demequina sp. NBRC 110056 TaxID=1570345 RepID=UPI0009FD8F35|nr:GNAT family N-acetyltransferase [Demequina sp. NBRC 110056]
MYRVAGASDVDALWTMLGYAFDWRGRGDLSLEALRDAPHIAHYVSGWGRAGDHGILAETESTVAGAAWVRLLTSKDPGYGYVADDVPELSMAVAPEFRGRGLGRELLTRVIDEATTRGVRAISLSVEDGNEAARHLYEASGFVVVGRNGGSDTMVTSVDRRGRDGRA